MGDWRAVVLTAGGGQLNLQYEMVFLFAQAFAAMRVVTLWRVSDG